MLCAWDVPSLSLFFLLMSLTLQVLEHHLLWFPTHFGGMHLLITPWDSIYAKQNYLRLCLFKNAFLIYSHLMYSLSWYGIIFPQSLKVLPYFFLAASVDIKQGDVIMIRDSFYEICLLSGSFQDLFISSIFRNFTKIFSCLYLGIFLSFFAGYSLCPSVGNSCL